MMAKGALDGVKVADFSWQMQLPMAIQWLADNGATVVRVESVTSPDTIRVMPPRRGEGVGMSGFYAFLTSNRYSLSINMKNRRGPELAKKLVAWADIFAHNFTVGTVDKWGLDYESIKKIKPDIIALESNFLGQTGPYAKAPGFGVMGVAQCGITNFTGWPDRSPLNPFVGFTDLVTPRFAASAILAALDYRSRTGKGAYIDICQLESSLQVIAAPLLQYTANGVESTRMGNECPYAAPHGAYPCRGDDRWCTIAVFTDEEWQSFIQAIGHPAWTKEDKFSTLLGRKQNEGELNTLVGQWTVNFTPEEVMTKLQTVGVAVGPVESPADILEDTQLKARNHFQYVENRELGMFPYNGQSYRLSKTPAEFRFSPPDIGENNEYVCRELLGMSEKEYVDYLISGVLE
jgi:benzylsuccinate CoA-transferase BbsF subunit